MSYLFTVVTLTNGGTVHFPYCVADVFEHGVLTLSSTRDDSEIAVLDNWTLAVVYDHNHHIEYAHENRQLTQHAA